ncbi:pickpocket protein 28-like [Papilio machaon]|uniref:pickpocket protein 28-like n=1 Tax=Papilio machaon TaxID=76193 RepID=UPI001E6635FF|nr:pickpocket protein 28-like [Papilio machaon]
MTSIVATGNTSNIKNSTTHGLPYIVNQDIHWIERLFWTSSFIFSLIIIYSLLSSQFSRFINSPTVMSVEMDYLEWNISYPALTLCPIIKTNFTTFNNLKYHLAILAYSRGRLLFCDSIKNIDEMRTSFLKELSNKTGMYLESYVWAIATASVLNLNTLALTDPGNTNPINPEDYAETAAMLFNQFDKRALTTNFNYSLSIQSAMTEFGMCHVINSNVAVFDDPLKWRNNNVNYVKTNVELSAFDADFYADIINDDVVSHIYVHSPNEPMISTFPSYTVDSDGFMTYGFQIWSTKISNELRSASIQVRQCRFLDEPISTRYPVYSYNNCLLECRIQLILKLCGCVPHFYKITGNERTCKLSELTCFYRNRKEIMALSVSNETLMKFTSRAHLPRTPKDCSCLSNCETDIYRKDREEYTPEPSASRVRIIFTAFPKMRIVRDRIFSFSDMFLRSGGVVNTCIGSSVISIMELILDVFRFPTYYLTQITINFVQKLTYYVLHKF